MVSVEEKLEEIRRKPFYSDTQSPEFPYGFVVGFKEGIFEVTPGPDEDTLNRYGAENFEPNSYIVIWAKYPNKGTQMKRSKKWKDFGG